MSRVLAYTSPARGHLYPIVPILSELKLKGHEISLRTLSSQVRMMSALGLDATPVAREIERIELADYEHRFQPAKGRRALQTFLARAEHEALDLGRAIAASDPDVLLVDVNCWGAATVAEASGRAWAIYSPYLLPLPSPNAPPYGLGLAPLRGPLGAVRDRLGSALVSAVMDRITLPTLNPLRARHGLEPLERFTGLLSAPPLLLVLTAEGFEYSREWPPNTTLVGEISWSPPQEPPAWLADMADPLVLVTCSTERQGDEQLARVALAALPPAGMSVLATTAAHDPREFQVPDGSRVERFLSHEAVLERAACVVCHGGMGITQKALSYGVPVVVVPFGRDQLETARRVQVADAGVRLSPRLLSPRRLTDAVTVALAKWPGAQRVRRAYASAGGQLAAAAEIEAIGCG